MYVPPDPPQAVVFAGDGQRISKWGRLLDKADIPSTMIVGVHGLTDETLRLHEYSPGFEPERFAAHEKFFVEDVRRWARSRFRVALPTERSAVFGVSAGGELALALGLRHPDVYGAVFSGSPGGGYKPSGVMPSSIPRTYLVAGTLEPFFLNNASPLRRSSFKTSCTSRAVPAPRADRSAVSWSRATPRTICRLARFTQAIGNTPAIAASRSQSGFLASPVISSENGSAVKLKWIERRSAAAVAFSIPSSPLWAARIETPPLRRATTRKLNSASFAVLSREDGTRGVKIS